MPRSTKSRTRSRSRNRTRRSTDGGTPRHGGRSGGTPRSTPRSSRNKGRSGRRSHRRQRRRSFSSSGSSGSPSVASDSDASYTSDGSGSGYSDGGRRAVRRSSGGHGRRRRRNRDRPPHHASEPRTRRRSRSHSRSRHRSRSRSRNRHAATPRRHGDAHWRASTASYASSDSHGQQQPHHHHGRGGATAPPLQPAPTRGSMPGGLRHSPMYQSQPASSHAAHQAEPGLAPPAAAYRDQLFEASRAPPVEHHPHHASVVTHHDGPGHTTFRPSPMRNPNPGASVSSGGLSADLSSMHVPSPLGGTVGASGASPASASDGWHATRHASRAHEPHGRAYGAPSMPSASPSSLRSDGTSGTGRVPAPHFGSSPQRPALRGAQAFATPQGGAAAAAAPATVWFQAPRVAGPRGLQAAQAGEPYSVYYFTSDGRTQWDHPYAHLGRCVCCCVWLCVMCGCASGSVWLSVAECGCVSVAWPWLWLWLCVCLRAVGLTAVGMAGPSRLNAWTKPAASTCSSPTHLRHPHPAVAPLATPPTLPWCGTRACQASGSLQCTATHMHLAVIPARLPARPRHPRPWVVTVGRLRPTSSARWTGTLGSTSACRWWWMLRRLSPPLANR